MDQAKVINTLFHQIAVLQNQGRRQAAYLARQEIERLLEQVRPDPHRLEQYGFKVYSQNDEDGILEEIFQRIGVDQGTFCEIGVESGIECNSLYLIHKGWRGAWLEGNPAQKAAIENRFGYILANRRLGLCISYITPDNVNALVRTTLEQQGLDAEALDFLSIDIDGMDIHLLEAIDFRPKVLCVEYNAKFPWHLRKRPVFDPQYKWRGGDFMGASLLALSESAGALGYRLVGTNFAGVNAFFVRADLAEGKFGSHLGVRELYNPARYYLVFDHYSADCGHRPDFGPYTDLVTAP